ncbi:hypothetical protein L1887_52058 [Cichorium endivia]|nr:hypothetical protein L1887_52058 [Cichorium endivia]
MCRSLAARSNKAHHPGLATAQARAALRVGTAFEARIECRCEVEAGQRGPRTGFESLSGVMMSRADCGGFVRPARIVTTIIRFGRHPQNGRIDVLSTSDHHAQLYICTRRLGGCARARAPRLGQPDRILGAEQCFDRAQAVRPLLAHYRPASGSALQARLCCPRSMPPHQTQEAQGRRQAACRMWAANNLVGKDGGIDFVIWTGDSARHDNDDKLPRSSKEIFELNRWTLDQLERAFPGVPLVPSVGNNDIFPHNILFPGPNAVTKEYVQIWQDHVPEYEFHTFEQGGYYVKELLPNRLAAMSLNTLYFYDNNKAVDGCVRTKRKHKTSIPERPNSTGWRCSWICSDSAACRCICWAMFRPPRATTLHDATSGIRISKTRRAVYTAAHNDAAVLQEGLPGDLRQDYSTLPGKGRTNEDLYSVFFIAPSIIPTYYPSMRLWTYNTTESARYTATTTTNTIQDDDDIDEVEQEDDDDVDLDDDEGMVGVRSRHHHRPVPPKKRKGKKHKKRRRARHASAASPSRTNTYLSLLGYSQWVMDIDAQNDAVERILHRDTLKKHDDDDEKRRKEAEAVEVDYRLEYATYPRLGFVGPRSTRNPATRQGQAGQAAAAHERVCAGERECAHHDGPGATTDGRQEALAAVCTTHLFRERLRAVRRNVQWRVPVGVRAQSRSVVPQRQVKGVVERFAHQRLEHKQAVGQLDVGAQRKHGRGYLGVDGRDGCGCSGKGEVHEHRAGRVAGAGMQVREDEQCAAGRGAVTVPATRSLRPAKSDGCTSLMGTSCAGSARDIEAILVPAWWLVVGGQVAHASEKESSPAFPTDEQWLTHKAQRGSGGGGDLGVRVACDSRAHLWRMLLQRLHARARHAPTTFVWHADHLCPVPRDDTIGATALHPEERAVRRGWSSSARRAAVPLGRAGGAVPLEQPAQQYRVCVQRAHVGAHRLPLRRGW